MNSFFISRADYQDIATRTKAKTLEWIHTPSNSLGAAASSWCSIMNSEWWESQRRLKPIQQASSFR